MIFGLLLIVILLFDAGGVADVLQRSLREMDAAPPCLRSRASTSGSADCRCLPALSFEVAARAGRLVLIGPNGAGKTTLFNILTGFTHPNAGAILFNAEDITAFTPERRATLGISRTFQIVRPFSGLSVLENVMVGAFAIERSAASARKRAINALERVGLDVAGSMRPAELTLSDRKRMELARCIATQPKVLLLDEVMCGLNPTEIAEMIALVRSIRADGIALIWSSILWM